MSHSSITRVQWYPHEMIRRADAFSKEYVVQFFSPKGPDYRGFDTLRAALKGCLKYSFSKVFRGDDCLFVQRQGTIVSGIPTVTGVQVIPLKKRLG